MMASIESHGRRSRVQWRALVAAYERSDLTQRAFCEQRGVAVSTFRYWRGQLAEEPGEVGQAPSGALQLVPVHLVAEPPAGTGSGIVLRAGAGVRIEVATGFDAATLQRVLATLAERA
jgi:hypothetical protein